MEPVVIEPKHQEENKEKIRVVVYARVSTDSESQEDSYENQVNYYRKRIESDPRYELVGIFADQAISGTTDKRPEFQLMIQQAKFHNFDMIITKNISRFSRRTADLLKYVGYLKELGINVRFEEEQIDTLGAQGTLMLSILGSIAQMEVENTSAHIQWTLNNKMKAGELVGRPNALGYDVIPVEIEIDGKKVTKKKIVINEEEAEIVRFIFSQYLQGVGTHVIGKKLKSMGKKTKTGKSIWHDSSISRILKNEKYTGTLVQGKSYTETPIGRKRRDNQGERSIYVIENHHDAIISQEDFDKVQEIMKSRSTIKGDGKKRGTTNNSKQSVFTSKIRCYYCGKNYVRRVAHKGTNSEKIIWQCSTYVKRGKNECPRSKAIDEEAIKIAFIETVEELLTDTMFSTYYLTDELFNDYLTKFERDNANIETQILDMEITLEKLKGKNDKLLELMLEGRITEEEFDKQREKNNKEIEEQNKLIAALKEEYGQEISRIKTTKEIRELIKNRDINGFDARLFDALVDFVEIGGPVRLKNLDAVDRPKKINIYLKYENLEKQRPLYQDEELLRELRNHIINHDGPIDLEKSQYEAQLLKDAIFGIDPETIKYE